MLTLPDETHFIDCHCILKKRGEYVEFTMDDTSDIRYQKGIISEVNGLIYFDIASPIGSLTFVFTDETKLISFILKHANRDFLNVE
jgi:hypothetical protein